MKFRALFILVLISAKIYAQDSLHGNVTIIQDYKIEQLLAKHKQLNETRQTESGWRVQIAAGTDKSKVYKIKSEFYNRFHDIPSYVSYWQPNFRLRVGDFKTRLEAWKCLVTIQASYPDSQIVPDDINLKPDDE